MISYHNRHTYRKSMFLIEAIGQRRKQPSRREWGGCRQPGNPPAHRVQHLAAAGCKDLPIATNWPAMCDINPHPLDPPEPWPFWLQPHQLIREAGTAGSRPILQRHIGHFRSSWVCSWIHKIVSLQLVRSPERALILVPDTSTENRVGGSILDLKKWKIPRV